MTEYEAIGARESPVQSVTVAAAAPILQSARQAEPRPVTPVTPVTLVSMQARADRWLARAMPEIRYRVMRLGYVGVTGLTLLTAAVILIFVLLIPAHQSIQTLTGHLSQAAQSGPLPAAQTLSPHQFAASLPSRDQVPALLGTVLTQATDAGVVLEQGKYTFTPASGNRLARYSFEFPVKAEYANVRAFINKSLIAIPALGLDKLHIERKNIGDTVVTAEVGFVIYLRGA